MSQASGVDFPAWAKSEAGLIFTGRVLPTRESTSWLVAHESGLAILRRLDSSLFPPGSAFARDDLSWLHAYLTVLAATEFPAPRPISVLDGHSWMERDGAMWELVSFLPGWVIGWRTTPAIAEVGRLLADYHNALARVPCPNQRPGAYPVDGLPFRPAPTAVRSDLETLALDLSALRGSQVERHVVHGDFTTHNVLATGKPASPSGVIDFALSHVEALWADIGFGLWRSGRPHQEAIGLDLDRVGDFVTGYGHRRPLQPSAAEAVPVYLRARGLQQLIKGHDRGLRPSDLLLRRVRWIAAHRSIIEDCVAAAIEAAQP